MKRMTKAQVKELAKFKSGQRVKYGDEIGVVGCPYSKQETVWYSVIFPRYGTGGRYYDGVSQIEEKDLVLAVATGSGGKT